MPRPGLGRRGGPPSPAFDCRRLGLAAAAILCPFKLPRPRPPPRPHCAIAPGDSGGRAGQRPRPGLEPAPPGQPGRPPPPGLAPARWERRRAGRGARREPPDAPPARRRPHRPAGTPGKAAAHQVVRREGDLVGAAREGHPRLSGSVWPPGLAVSPAGLLRPGPGPGREPGWPSPGPRLRRRRRPPGARGTPGRAVGPARAAFCLGSPAQRGGKRALEGRGAPRGAYLARVPGPRSPAPPRGSPGRALDGPGVARGQRPPAPPECPPRPPPPPPAATPGGRRGPLPAPRRQLQPGAA